MTIRSNVSAVVLFLFGCDRWPAWLKRDSQSDKFMPARDRCLDARPHSGVTAVTRDTIVDGMVLKSPFKFEARVTAGTAPSNSN